MKREVSIITVCYNSGNTIARTFDSLLSQTVKNFEYIVVDGKSNDNTVDIIKRYEPMFIEAGIDFKWSSEPDKGIYDAMNKGLSKATGRLIGILNSDDVYFPKTVQIVTNEWKEDASYQVYHGMMRYESNGELVSITGHCSNVLYKGGMIEHPTCFVPRNTYEKYGTFDLKYRYAADLDLMMRIKMGGGRFRLIPEVLAVYSEDGAGNCNTSRDEAIDIKKKYGIINVSFAVMQKVKNHLYHMIRR